jgi:hypothetical protein
MMNLVAMQGRLLRRLDLLENRVAELEGKAGR